MSELTDRELSQLPAKRTWSDAEALDLYATDADGWELCVGAPVPQFVETTPDRIRWAHCIRLAVQITGEPGTSPLAGSTARMMFQDRDQYKI